LIEAIGQFHASATLLLKTSPATTEQQAEWIAQPLWELWRTEISSAGNRTTIRHTPSQDPSRCGSGWTTEDMRVLTKTKCVLKKCDKFRGSTIMTAQLKGAALLVHYFVDN